MKITVNQINNGYTVNFSGETDSNPLSSFAKLFSTAQDEIYDPILSKASKDANNMRIVFAATKAELIALVNKFLEENIEE